MHSREFLLSLHRTMYTIRTFETRCIQLYRQGLIRGYFHPYLGEEAIATGVCAALAATDFIISTHRGHGHCIAKGADIKPMVAELFGKKTGYCLGLGGSMHIADLSKGNLGANAIVGANIALAVGAAFAFKLRQEPHVMVAFTSDGSVNNGVFMESLNLAGIWNLPLIVVIENNQYAVSTPIAQSTRETALYKRGLALGVESYTIDGNDVLEVYSHLSQSVAKCRENKGPILVEAMTFRHGGHHVNDPGSYMPQEKLEYYKSIDPLLRSRETLLANSVKENEIANLEKNIENEIEEAVEYANASDELLFSEFARMVEEY
jgi:acetoin:2,6-dichlorophenolindophenol oxidoreductase subunit alpha